MDINAFKNGPFLTGYALQRIHRTDRLKASIGHVKRVHAKENAVNKRMLFVVCLLRSLFVFGMEGNAGEDPLSAQAKRDVEIYFSCYPIFDIAMQEGEEIFQGHLGEFRTEFQNRCDGNTLKENSAFIKVMEAEIKRRKAASLDILKEHLFEPEEVSVRQAQLNAIERVFADFVASHHIRESGDEDSPLPIYQGKDARLQVQGYERVPDVSLLTSLSSRPGSLLVGAIFLAAVVWMKYQ